MKYITLIFLISIVSNAAASTLTCSGKITNIETLRGSDHSLIKVELTNNEGSRSYKACVKSTLGNSKVECQGQLSILLSAFHSQNNVDLVFKSTTHAGIVDESSCSEINEWGPYLSDVILKK